MNRAPVSRAGVLNLLVLCAAAAVCAALLFLQAGMQVSFGYMVREVLRQTPGDAVVIRTQSRPDDTTELRAVPQVQVVARERYPRAGFIVSPPNLGTESSSRGARASFGGTEQYYVPVEPAYFRVRHLVAASGRLLRPDDTGAVAVIGAALAEQMRWSVGNVVSDMHTNIINGSFRIVGILEPVVDGDSLSVSSPGARFVEKGSINQTVYIPYGQTVTWVGHDSTNLYVRDVYWVALKEDQREAGLAALTALVDRWASERNGWAELLPVSSSAVQRVVTESLAGSFTAVSVIIGAAAVIAFGALFLTRVVGRAGEIGVLRTLGMTDRQVVGQQLAQASVLSAVGTVTGWGLFLVIGKRFGLAPLALSTKPPVAAMAAVAFLAGPLAVLAPARFASRITPASSLRDELRWGDRRRRIDLRQATVLLAFALAVGATNLAAGLGQATIKQVDAYMLNVGANDIEIVPGSAGAGGLTLEPLTIYDRVRGLAGVETVQSLVSLSRANACSADGLTWHPLDLAGVLGEAPTILGLSTPGSGLPTLAPGEIALGSDAAARLGLDPATATGQTVFVNDVAKERLVVAVLPPRPAGSLDRFGDRDRTVFMPYSDLAQVADAWNATFSVTVRGLTADAAERALSALSVLHDEGMTVKRPLGDLSTLRALKSDYAVLVSMGAVAVSAVVAVAVAAIMWNRVWENRRNIAIQMALGATSREVAGEVFAETLILSLAATGLGLAGGTLLYWAVARTTDLPPLPGLGGVALGVGIGLVLALSIGVVVHQRVLRTPVSSFLRGQE